MPEVFNDASAFYDFLMTELKNDVKESDVSPYSIWYKDGFEDAKFKIHILYLKFRKGESPYDLHK